MNKLVMVIRKKIFKIKKDMQFWFCIISLLSVSITIIILFLSHGSFFPKMFFNDFTDTGMDFFHSIEYTRGRSPYDLFNTLYPPLANLFFYILYRFVPYEQSNQWPDTFIDSIRTKGTHTDLRVWQPTMMLFICFILLTSALLILLIQCILNYSAKSGFVGFCMVLSYGFLYSYERGNIVIIAALCCMFFVAFYESENKILSELALIALAIGAGLKIYPALFGILLIYNKQYAKSVRAILYGIIAFIAPVFLFHEGINGIEKFFHILFAYVHTDEISLTGYSFDKILNYLIIILSRISHTKVNETFWLQFSVWINIAVICSLLIRGFFLQQRWKKILVCTLAILLYQTQPIYIIIFLIIPLVFMIKDEKNIEKSNFIPFITLTLTQVLLPIGDSDNGIISFIFLRYQICMVILFVCMFVKNKPAGNN